MKTKFGFPGAALLAATCTCAMLLFTGCASVNAPDQEALLSAAGFRVQRATTVKQEEAYVALPPYKVHRAETKDKIFYVYKDEKHGVTYVGGEPEYQRYQELAVQKSIARDYYWAAKMNSDAAMGWYGAWGPGAFWW